MRLLIRLVLTVVLCLSVVGMGIHYDATQEQHQPYPSTHSLTTDYTAHIGEEVFLFGTVERVDGNTVEILVGDAGGTLTMTVEGTDVSVQSGGVIQVVGELRPDRTITASNVVVVNPAGESKLYKYVVSLVGVTLVLLVFFREWRIDTGDLCFEVK